MEFDAGLHDFCDFSCSPAKLSPHFALPTISTVYTLYWYSCTVLMKTLHLSIPHTRTGLAPAACACSNAPMLALPRLDRLRRPGGALLHSRWFKWCIRLTGGMHGVWRWVPGAVARPLHCRHWAWSVVVVVRAEAAAEAAVLGCEGAHGWLRGGLRLPLGLRVALSGAIRWPCA